MTPKRSRSDVLCLSALATVWIGVRGLSAGHYDVALLAVVYLAYVVATLVHEARMRREARLLEDQLARFRRYHKAVS